MKKKVSGDTHNQGFLINLLGWMETKLRPHILFQRHRPPEKTKGKTLKSQIWCLFSQYVP